MIIIIDYGMGNLLSVKKALTRLNIQNEISNSEDNILNANKLILPGVGNFKKGMENIRSKGIFEILNEAVIEKKIPILGICLGMQLMTEYSEEGDCNGLGWFRGITKKFVFPDNKNKIPHMGWNNIEVKNENSLTKNINSKDLFYFVHSYYVTLENYNEITSYTDYGLVFSSIIKRNNIFGCQFHPEKSHNSGLMLLDNFANI